jgi:hypothetical protein
LNGRIEKRNVSHRDGNTSAEIAELKHKNQLPFIAIGTTLSLPVPEKIKKLITAVIFFFSYAGVFSRLHLLNVTVQRVIARDGTYSGI